MVQMPVRRTTADFARFYVWTTTERAVVNNRIAVKIMAPLLLLTISALVSPSGHAAARRYTVWKKSLRYDTAFNIPGAANAHVSPTDPTCGSSGKTCRLAGDGEVDIGGMSFDPIGGSGKVNVTITVKDDNNLYGRVPISACQDLTGNRVCGDPGEPQVSRCLSPKQSMVLAATRNKPITIFVSAFNGCPDISNVGNSQGGATRGLVSLTALLPR
jgi:hypothetical protein